MTELMSITKTSLRVLRYVGAYVARHGYSPTVREICRAMEWSSPNSAQGQLARLRKAGLIQDQGSRTTKVTDKGQQLLAEVEAGSGS